MRRPVRVESARVDMQNPWCKNLTFVIHGAAAVISTLPARLAVAPSTSPGRQGSSMSLASDDPEHVMPTALSNDRYRPKDCHSVGQLSSLNRLRKKPATNARGAVSRPHGG